MPFFAAIFPYLGSLVASILTSSAVRFVALKVLIVGLATTVFSDVLKNIVVWFFSTVQTYVASSVGLSELPGASIVLSGQAGYMGSLLRLDECFSILMAGLAIKVMLKLTPFIG